MVENIIYNVLIAALAVINSAGFIAAAIDKHRARKHMWRIPEKTFFLIALIGGCPGVYLGLILFRHKTRHWYFMTGIPSIFIMQLLIVYLIFIK